MVIFAREQQKGSMTHETSGSAISYKKSTRLMVRLEVRRKADSSFASGQWSVRSAPMWDLAPSLTFFTMATTRAHRIKGGGARERRRLQGFQQASEYYSYQKFVEFPTPVVPSPPLVKHASDPLLQLQPGTRFHLRSSPDSNSAEHLDYISAPRCTLSIRRCRLSGSSSTPFYPF